MKFKLFKWFVRLWDLLVLAFLLGYFFHDGFRALFDSTSYMVKALVWTGIVLFFYYSAISWYKVIKQSLINVISSKEFQEAPTREELLQKEEENAHCDFVTGGDEEDN